MAKYAVNKELTIYGGGRSAGFLNKSIIDPMVGTRMRF